MYKKIDTNTFNQIWKICKSKKIEYEGYSRSVCPEREGKFLKFLKEVGIEQPRVASYANELEIANELGLFHSMYYEIDRESKEPKITIDLTNFNNKLIITIHTLNGVDSFYREEKWID